MKKSFETLADEVNELLTRNLPKEKSVKPNVPPFKPNRVYADPDCINRLFLDVVQHDFTPVRILKNGIATVVFWEDGTKTVVKCGAEDFPDDYDAFTAALAIKIFGSNSRLKRMLKAKTFEQKGKE